MAAKAAALIALIGGLVGCAITAQNVSLRPQIDIASRPDLGGGRRVRIVSVDARPAKLIGFRGGVMKSGPITAKDDLAAVIARTIGEGLRMRGFQIVSSDPADATIRIEIVNLSYDMLQLPRSIAVVTKATLKVVAEAGGPSYEQSFSKELLKPVHAAPSATFNEQLLNRTLAALIDDLFLDERFVATMAGKSS